jgi:hypothetical protein
MMQSKDHQAHHTPVTLDFQWQCGKKKASEFHRRDGGCSHPYSAILPLDVFEENPATQIHRKYIFFL